MSKRSTSSVAQAALAEKAAETATLPERADGLVSLLVWSAPTINRSLVLCHAPGDDASNPMNLVSVTVRSNVNFRKNMPLLARRTSPKRFILEGPCPSWPGKW